MRILHYKFHNETILIVEDLADFITNLIGKHRMLKRKVKELFAIKHMMKWTYDYDSFGDIFFGYQTHFCCRHIAMLLTFLFSDHDRFPIFAIGTDNHMINIILDSKTKKHMIFDMTNEVIIDQKHSYPLVIDLFDPMIRYKFKFGISINKIEHFRNKVIPHKRFRLF